MTETELQQIENALHLVLPPDYRAFHLAQSDQVGADPLHWLFSTPGEVIGNTQAPIFGEYGESDWKSSYVGIADSGSGDLYFLDADLLNSPVFCLSHEDHRITEDWPNFAVFVAESKREAAEGERQRAEGESQRCRDRERTKRSLTFGCLLWLAAVLVLVLLIINHRKNHVHNRADAGNTPPYSAPIPGR